MASYIKSLQKYVLYNECSSDTKFIKIDAPQGSNFGPFIFLNYINDLSNWVCFLCTCVCIQYFSVCCAVLCSLPLMGSDIISTYISVNLIKCNLVS